MAIEESHPLTLAPDLFDQLTAYERKRALAAWNLQYEAANRLVHPVTKHRRPEVIARSVILGAISGKYQIWLYVAFLVVVQVVAQVMIDGAENLWVIACALAAAATIALPAAARWRRRRRLVTDYFAAHFPPGPGTLPERR